MNNLALQDSLMHLRPLRVALFIGVVLSAFAAFASETVMTDMSRCTPLFDFSHAADRDAWREQNDTVMGGNSRGRIEQTEDSLVFSGDLVTLNGGFVQMQARLPEGSLSGMTSLRLIASGDGRPWRVRIMTDTRVSRAATRRWGSAVIAESGVGLDGPRVAFSVPLQDLGQADPAPATVTKANPEPSVRGRPVPDAVWDADRAWSIGLILADRRDAPFRIEVQGIEVCR